MNFEEARPEYYEGLKIFQEHTNQQDQLKKLLSSFFSHLRSGIEEKLDQEPMGTKLYNNLSDFVYRPLSWCDIGSGDGSFTSRMFEALEETSFQAPDYTGLEPDSYFVEASRKQFSEHDNVEIIQTTALEGNFQQGLFDVVSGMNVLYFANDLSLLKRDLDASLQPVGLGLFIQNALFTEKAGRAFIGDHFKDYKASIETEVFFPTMPPRGFELITNKASVADIQNDSILADDEKKNAITTKMIIDSMGGISTETDAGQEVAKKYQTRITGDDFGGKGRYVSDNELLVYVSPKAPEALHQIVKTALDNVRLDICNEQQMNTPQYKAAQPKHL